MPPELTLRATEAATLAFGYQPWLVELSCLIALAAAYAALRTIWKLEGTDGHQARLSIAAASLAMGVGTWSMHFLGILALDGPFELAFDPLLTGLSVLPAILASFVGILVIARPQASLHHTLFGGVIMGGGIAAMHYSGMAAITLDAEIHHDRVPLVLSLAVASVLASTALVVVRHARTRPSRQGQIFAVSAFGLGGAVVGMHYAGMAALHLHPAAGALAAPGILDESVLAWLVTLGTVLVLIAAVSATILDRKAFAIKARVRGRSRQIMAAIEGLTEGFIVFDEHRRAVVWNALAEEISPEVRHVLKPGARYHEVFAKIDHTPCCRIDFPSSGDDSRQCCELELADGRCFQLNQVRTSAGFLVVSFTDITAHKRGRERLSAFFDQAPYPFVVVNREGVIVLMNRAALAVFGYGAAELLGSSVCVLVPTDRRADILRRVESCLESHSPGMVPPERDPACVRKDGRIFPVEASFSVLDFDREPLVVFGVRDMTERRQMEAQLVQSQKMELVGQLTGGLAHDFNNLLTVVMGNLQLLEACMDSDTQGMEQIHDAIEATRRGSDLTKRLLAFSRRQLLAPKPTCVAHLVTDLVPLMRKSITAEIEIITRLPDDVWTVEVDPTQLESALFNLALNSRDAMEDGGKIVIESRNVVLDEEYSARRAEVEPGEYVMITVSDTGSGMSREVLEQVFEPFFTTKESGRGSGLGLSTVYGFVKQSKGHITIYSEPGFGTSVRIYLPRTKALAESVAAATGSNKLIPSGDERILLVDDDEAVRRTVAQLLTSLGYEVVEAATGREALALFEQDERFDLMLTDIVMPGGMSGLDLARQVREQDGSVKILLTSGYTDTALFARGVLGPEDYVLNKPYRKSELAQKLRWVLDAPVPSSSGPDPKPAAPLWQPA